MSDRVSVLCDAVREARWDMVAELARKFVSFDWETWLIQPGVPAPPPVCASVAVMTDVLIPSADTIQTSIALAEEGLEQFEALLADDDIVIVGANTVYDVMVSVVAAAERGRDLLPRVWAAYEAGRFYDVAIAQQVHATGLGILGKDPKTGRGLPSGNRYSLDTCVLHVLGRDDAKKNSAWRLRYAELADTPLSDWPADARQYPQDDARNTLEVALAQCGVLPAVRKHVWERRAEFNGGVRCRYCDALPLAADDCLRAGEPHWNLHCLGDECATHWAMWMGACWGFLVDRGAVLAVLEDTREKRAQYVSGLREAGFLRADGTKDTAAINRAVARAYHAVGLCPRCDGTGRAPSEKTGNLINCSWCSGTGLDVRDPETGVPLTPTDRVSRARDVLDESGDETLIELSEYGRLAKTEETYVPYLLGEKKTRGRT